MHYLDTSVLASYYCPETLSGKVQKTVSDMGRPSISWLVELELHSALAIKVRTGVMSSSIAQRIASIFQVHVADDRFEMVDISVREHALARQWLGTFSSPLRTLDALHLATAFAHDLILVSADRALIRSAAKFGGKHQLIV